MSLAQASFHERIRCSEFITWPWRRQYREFPSKTQFQVRRMPEQIEKVKSLPMLNKKNNLPKRDQFPVLHVLTRMLSLIDAHPVRAVGFILILGILLATISMINRPPSLQAGETDSWWVIALNLIHGHGYSLCMTQYFPFCGPSNQVTATREPVPVLLFAVAAWVGKESLWVAAIVEAIVYLAIILTVYFLTREWADARSAVIASFLWAVYLPALELIPQVSGDLFAALCTSLGILLVLRARKTQSTLHWTLAGAALGVAFLSRSATLVIALLVIGEQAIESWRQHLRPKDLIRPALLLSGLVILIMTPWLIRNRLTLGRPILGSSLTGYNLYRHNYMLGKNPYFRYVGPEEGTQAIKDLISRHTELRGDENEAKMDLIYRGEALRIIKAHSAQYVQLSAYRFLPLWFDWKIAEAYGRPTNRYGYLIMILQAVLLFLALLGINNMAGLTWPLWGSILAISLAYMAVDARLLYVLPVMPLVISLGGVGGSNLLKKALKES
jgi:4-amino-4-deoxy-L-arabinose transferase-like glycosyltransferase